ncbi:hypothetical protein [Rhodospirillum rubrum]|uniref:Antifreeze glycopeptide polyprotein n=1 Tax=Rhodospirillum rubrum (strain ATCC 11170 / ATH 1.1.1 / DSM 467 / LMG 4362 / NCIMB 8255 / S1) TaxID=269796 RepID=Q2RMW2_RHORT|nr:hypothetical protein [Rhodospirillum rubrum]ABC24533.1 hypothetical protein Rru_A3739 [Rhodospirillum rubrum ATCC 11170]MBK5956258.1 hypothetical protein [Rhodospirillum rubrum]QXG80450.1 hypothetical protein KUL73_19285 [Rhodospirillum rubrum]
MTGSKRVRRFAAARRRTGPVACALAVAGTLIAAAPGLAQSPYPLTPGSAGSRSAGAPPLAGPFGAARPGRQGILMQDLGAPSADGLGLLAPAEGGLGPALWQGLGLQGALALLDGLPPALASRAMADLTRRLLLSSANPPAASGAAPADSLLLRRVDLLGRYGFPAEVVALVEALPAQSLTPALARRRAEALLIQSHPEQACQPTANPPPTATPLAVEDDVFWHKLQIFCQLQAGKPEQAALGMAMLREQGIKDEGFFILAERMGKLAKGKPRKPTAFDALTIALYRGADQPIPAEAASPPTPWLDRAIALSAPTPPAQRLASAERAEAGGALPADALAYLYGDTPIRAADRTKILSTLLTEGTPLARAQAFQAVRALRDPVAKANAAAELLRGLRQRDGGLYLSMVRALLPSLREMLVLDGALAAAPEIARAFYGVGDIRAAGPWVRLLQANSRDLFRGQGGLASLVTMDRLANQGDIDGAFPANPAAILMNPAVSLDRLGAAAARRATGETVLLALSTLAGVGGPTKAPPGVLRQVVLALQGVGLNDAATAIGLEALAVQAP